MVQIGQFLIHYKIGTLYLLLKVIIIAIFYAMVIKKPEANDDDQETGLDEGEEWLHDHFTEKDLNDPRKLRMLEDMKKSAPLPPELDFLNTVKEER